MHQSHRRTENSLSTPRSLTPLPSHMGFVDLEWFLPPTFLLSWLSSRHTVTELRQNFHREVSLNSAVRDTLLFAPRPQACSSSPHHPALSLLAHFRCLNGDCEVPESETLSFKLVSTKLSQIGSQVHEDWVNRWLQAYKVTNCLFVSIFSAISLKVLVHSASQIQTLWIQTLWMVSPLQWNKQALHVFMSW